MKFVSKLAILVAAGLLSASGSFAQTVTTADIPFDFICQQTAMPHGTYEISTVDGYAIQVSSKDGKHHAMSVVASTDTVRGPGRKLVFHRYGDQYFLTEIQSWTGSNDIQLPTSKSEKQAKLNEARLEERGTVLVAVK